MDEQKQTTAPRREVLHYCDGGGCLNALVLDEGESLADVFGQDFTRGWTRAGGKLWCETHRKDGERFANTGCDECIPHEGVHEVACGRVAYERQLPQWTTGKPPPLYPLLDVSMVGPWTGPLTARQHAYALELARHTVVSDGGAGHGIPQRLLVARALLELTESGGLSALDSWRLVDTGLGRVRYQQRRRLLAEGRAVHMLQLVREVGARHAEEVRQRSEERRAEELQSWGLVAAGVSRAEEVEMRAARAESAVERALARCCGREGEACPACADLRRALGMDLCGCCSAPLPSHRTAVCETCVPERDWFAQGQLVETVLGQLEVQRVGEEVVLELPPSIRFAPLVEYLAAADVRREGSLLSVLGTSVRRYTTPRGLYVYLPAPAEGFGVLQVPTDLHRTARHIEFVKADHTAWVMKSADMDSGPIPLTTESMTLREATAVTWEGDWTQAQSEQADEVMDQMPGAWVRTAGGEG